MKILAAIAFLAISAAAESRWMLEIHSSTDDDYFLADEKADEEFFVDLRLNPPPTEFWMTIGGARAESYEMELEFPEDDDRAAPVAGIAFKQVGAGETERNSQVVNPDGSAIETRSTVKVGKPDIWNL